ncbi:ATP-binding protein [Oceanimonas sp. CHS3-5]|uniref:ATP-binding protein n=1 Tax=Oceanimonas sp. CHS3-5 TaxID=3068186 RepID=UPI00273F47DB|nr:ATP-binding protein [Oceanimonas sp. CHS3-5]MDP5290870.1 ATP-binding protein [Oceanimonas sp. CHS3-5]
MSKPDYYRHPNAHYRGNPFIEGLGQPLTLEQFYANCEIPFDGDLDLSGVDESLHGYYTRTAIDQLADVYTVQDEAYRLYDVMRRMIEAGYAKRNPLREDMRRILVAIDRDKADPWKAMHTSSLDLLSVQQSFLLLGLSGRGKSTMVRQICKQLKQVVEHTRYTDHSGEESIINKTQVTYLYVEVHDRRGQKAVLLNLLEAIDTATGEEYRHAHRNKSVNELITTVRKAFIGHSVGMVIIDEAQNLATQARSEVLNSNEKTSMKFIEELFNRVGVPLMFVGTLATLSLFKRETTIGRRATKNGSLLLASCEIDSPFWKRFTRLLCQTQLLKNQTTPTDMLRRHLHHLSVGIPAIATSLVRATLSYLTFLSPQDQDLSIAALDDTFNREFKVLKPALTALRKGDYHKFEDFEPMLLLESAEQSADDRDAIEQRVSQLAEASLLQGKVKLRDKPQKPEVKKRAALDQLSPEHLLGQLGYPLDKGR